METSESFRLVLEEKYSFLRVLSIMRAFNIVTLNSFHDCLLQEEATKG